MADRPANGAVTAVDSSRPSDDDPTAVDVLIVGAGPAGCAAALTLAAAGVTVQVVDKATFPRDKICGDGLTTLALRLLADLDFDPATVPSWRVVDDCTVRGPSTAAIRFPLPDSGGDFAAIARRSEFDHALVQQVIAAGVPVRQACAVTGIEHDGTAATVAMVDSGASGSVRAPDLIRARQVIAADGMWSPVRKLLEPDGYRGEWHAWRQYIDGVTGPAADELLVWFDADLLPGYAWAFPLADGRVNLGFGVMRSADRKGADLRALADGLIDRPHVRAALGADARPESPGRSWPIPARIDEATLSIGRVLFVGDAAAATDPMTGEGIGQALLTGRRAAEAIIAGGTAAEVADRYRAEVRSELVADHKMAVVLGHMLARGWGADLAVRIVGSTAWTRRNFARWLFEDYPRALVFTPRRWRRRMFTGPGARFPGV